MSSSPVPELKPGQTIRPVVSMNQAREMIQTYFGLEADNFKEFNSYDDKNFYCEIGKPFKKYNLKVLNSMDSKKTAHVEAEHGIMFYLSSNSINCPVPHKTVDGETYKVVSIPREDVENENSETATNAMHLVRLLSYVEGQIMYHVLISEKLLYKTGLYIAEVEELLKACEYPVLKTHTTLWMMSEVMQLQKFVYCIKKESDKFNLVQSVLKGYKENIEPILDSLEKGVLHGDYNEQNILVLPSQVDKDDYDISGIIDFGDTHWGPYIFELAITVCYMMLESMRCKIVDPFDAVGHVVAGYCKIRKVPDSELKLMRTLVSCRLCQSLVMGAYSSSQDPDNKYILTTASRGWTLLEQVWNEKSDDQVFAMCKKYLS
ncbi:hydroxylysine kinase [Folsomia candida]|uniref:Hydroxylysine kinase n=1 Tax=Folsomia candida TaxID=158441 RepID=A0A226EUA7_FOLCA|nr:hydroxylysine kinase [Folsomia candida]OXA61109.1 Hydroxylysine kinase [Folsomia candida]